MNDFISTYEMLNGLLADPATALFTSAASAHDNARFAHFFIVRQFIQDIMRKVSANFVSQDKKCAICANRGEARVGLQIDR